MAPPEEVAFRRVLEPLRAEETLKIPAKALGLSEEEFGRRRRSSPLRAVAGRCQVRYAGLRQREVAKRLGMATGGAVSAQLARLPALIQGDGQMGRRMAAIERRLEQKRAETAEGVRRELRTKP